MRAPSICLAKESGHPSGGKSGLKASASGRDCPEAEATFSQDMEACPFGTLVCVRSADGEEAAAIRSEYHPYWLDENREFPLLFNPVEWKLCAPGEIVG